MIPIELILRAVENWKRCKREVAVAYDYTNFPNGSDLVKEADMLIAEIRNLLPEGFRDRV